MINENTFVKVSVVAVSVRLLLMLYQIRVIYTCSKVRIKCYDNYVGQLCGLFQMNYIAIRHILHTRSTYSGSGRLRSTETNRTNM